MFRFMRPAIVLAALITVGAWGFSNYMMPKASLKFWTRLIDITQKKPALNIKPNVFYHDIEQFAILVTDKDEDNVHVHNVTIYDKSERGEYNNVLIAESAEMYAVESANALVMRLHNGKQYQALKPESQVGGKKGKREHLRTQFAEWEMALDLSGLEMGSSNENLYRNHYRMLNQRQLTEAMDSIRNSTRKRLESMGPVVHSYFWFRRDTTASVDPSLPAEGGLVAGIAPEYRKGAASRALVAARNASSFARQIEDNTRYAEDRIAQHAIEWHRKWSLAAACFVFLFVGAPLGAIIRKGGFGMPVVTSVLIFVLFYVLYITGEKFADQQVWSVPFGMWFPNLAMFPFSLWLTRTAMNDSPLLNGEAWRESLQRFWGVFRKA